MVLRYLLVLLDAILLFAGLRHLFWTDQVIAFYQRHPGWDLTRKAIPGESPTRSDQRRYRFIGVALLIVFVLLGGIGLGWSRFLRIFTG
jgi:hypothetical protein